jgi:hypothetical protein
VITLVKIGASTKRTPNYTPLAYACQVLREGRCADGMTSALTRAGKRRASDAAASGAAQC